MMASKLQVCAVLFLFCLAVDGRKFRFRRDDTDGNGNPVQADQGEQPEQSTGGAPSDDDAPPEVECEGTDCAEDLEPLPEPEHGPCYNEFCVTTPQKNTVREEFAQAECKPLCEKMQLQWDGKWEAAIMGEQYPNEKNKLFVNKCDGVICYCLNQC